MSTPDRVRLLIEPLVADVGVDLYDLELNGGSLRVLVDLPGGVDMGVITELTRRISRALDEHDPISGHFTLEVSSPGLERPLRTPEHFVRAVGTKVTVKTVSGLEGGRRVAGTLIEADDDGIVVELDQPGGERRHLAHDEIERARTVFEWGPAPKPGKGPKAPSSKAAKAKKARAASAEPAEPGSPTTSGKATRATRPGSTPSPNEKVPTS
jgi:ribosome maturation factor RimP